MRARAVRHRARVTRGRRASQMHTTNAIVQAGVAGALRNLSVNPVHRSAIVEAGGTEALLLAAQVRNHDPNAASRPARVTGQPIHRASAAQIHTGNEKLQKEVQGALRNLQDPASKQGAASNRADQSAPTLPLAAAPAAAPAPAAAWAPPQQPQQDGSKPGVRRMLSSLRPSSPRGRQPTPPKNRSMSRSRSPGSTFLPFGGLSRRLSRQSPTPRS